MKACLECRQAKRKCVQQKAGLLVSCIRCLRHGLLCTNSKSKLRDQKRALVARPLSGSSSPLDESSCASPADDSVNDFLADSEAVAEMVQHYLTKIHDRPHSIFHVNTLLRDIRDGRIHRPLLLAICAMGAHLSSRPTARSLEPLLTSECKRLFREDVENISLENVQTCILVANLCAAHSNPSSEFLFFQMAISMIQFMNIAAEDREDSAITQEIKIRVWWTLFMADNWCCSSLGLPRQMKDFPRPARLPLDERAFCALTPHQPPSVLESCGNPGLWAHMLTLVEFFAPIQELNRRIVQDKDLQQSQIEQDTSRLAQQLEEWQERLPAHACMSEINLLSHAGWGTGGPFLALHLGFHHYATLLYYQYLDTQFVPTAQSLLFAARCKYHARSYSSLLARGRQQARCEAVYPTVGQMTIVSSSVLLHTLLFGAEDELVQSRHCLQTNFEALLDLAQYWPCVEIMINRLMNFQNTCLLLSHSHTHRLDRWMVRFLFEYALPLDNKTSDPPCAAVDLEIISAQAKLEYVRSKNV